MQEMIEQIREDVKRQVKELREVCNELRPPLLAQFGLGKAIVSHAASFEEKHPGLKIILDLPEDDEKLLETLPENITLALYRIYQEALNNVVHHAQAGQVAVHLSRAGARIVFEIHDNGKGFHPSDDWVELARGDHFGLVGMKERAEAVGGSFKVFSQPGDGATIRVEI